MESDPATKQKIIVLLSEIFKTKPRLLVNVMNTLEPHN